MFFSFSPKDKNKDFKIIMENFNEKIQNLSGLDKAKLVKKYLEKYHSVDTIIEKIVHFSSNLSITNLNFSLSLVRINCHNLMFKLSKTDKQKWLTYSCFWNILRFQEIRSIIKKKFILKILKDNQFNSESEKVRNVYIGCLSNLSLLDTYQKSIMIELLKNNKIIYGDDIFKSLCGLCANLCLDDEICRIFINTELYFYILKEMKNILIKTKKINNTLLRNFMAMLNNVSSINQFIKPIIKIDLYESLIKIIEHDNNLDFFNVTMLRVFDISDIDETTSLHLANKYKYKDLVLEKIKNNFNIDTKNKFGNTILHDSLINKQFNLSKHYILSNADINIKNNEDKSPLDLEKGFVELTLEFKNKIDNSYKNTINKTFENHCKLYEKHLIKSVYNFIDNRELMFEL